MLSQILRLRPLPADSSFSLLSRVKFTYRADTDPTDCAVQVRSLSALPLNWPSGTQNPDKREKGCRQQWRAPPLTLPPEPSVRR
jgi:hypothetical protein